MNLPSIVATQLIYLNKAVALQLMGEIELIIVHLPLTERIGTRDGPNTPMKLFDFVPASGDIFTGYATGRGYTASSHSPFVKYAVSYFIEKININ